MQWQWDRNNETMLKIYTDWANHYLEKASSVQRVLDLQKDLSDGVLLAQIIQAVTSSTIQGVNYQPKNASHAIANLNCCLDFLRELGVCVDELSAKDLKDGNLKCVLGLFFNLSRFKQQQKSKAEAEMTSKIPSSGLKQPTSTSKTKIAPPPNISAKTPPIVITANGGAPKKSGLIQPGQRQSVGSTVSSRSSSPVSGIPSPASKLATVANQKPKRVETSASSGSFSSVISSQSSSNGPKQSSALPTPQAQGIPQTMEASQSQPQASGGMLDKLFKSKKASSPTKSKTEEKTKTKLSSSKKDSSNEETSKGASGIPRGGNNSTLERSRTPSRESLAKCRIQPPGAVSGSKTANRLSSDSGIHSPAENKSMEGLVRNNSLPSSRVHSIKEQTPISRQTTQRASTNSPLTIKKDQRLLPKALLTYKSSSDQSTVSYSDPLQQNSLDLQNSLPSTGGLLASGSLLPNCTDGQKIQLRIPPPLPSSISSSSDGRPVYNQLPGINHYIKPSNVTTANHRAIVDREQKDNINEARKLQQISKVKADCDTQTDTSALQKIAAQVSKSHTHEGHIQQRNILLREVGNQTDQGKPSINQMNQGKPNNSQTDEGKPSNNQTDHGKPNNGGVHILPGQKTSHAKIMSLTTKVKESSSGTDSSNSSLSKHSHSSTDSIIHRPVALTATSTPPRTSTSKKEDLEKSDDGADNFHVEPMQPLDKLASYEFLQRLGRSNGAASPSKTPLSRFTPMNRSFNSKSSTRNIHEDYASDAERYTNGYLSDAGHSGRASDYADFSGYLSEGGASSYARRMQQRFREGMQMVRECLDSKYLDADDESFDDASSVSSGDISDALDLAEEPLCQQNNSGPASDIFFKNDIRSTPSYISNNKNTNALVDMKDRPPTAPGSGRLPLSLARSSVGANGYMSDTGYNYSIAEQCLAEQQRAKGLISSKTQQSLTTKQDELYKYHTLGRSRGTSGSTAAGAANYSLLNGSFNGQSSGDHSRLSYPLTGGDYSQASFAGSNNGSGAWMKEGATSRRSLGSEPDPQNHDRYRGLLQQHSCYKHATTSAQHPGSIPSHVQQARAASFSLGHKLAATQHPNPHHYTIGPQGLQHQLLTQSSGIYPSMHQGGYESDSGVMERRVCSQCCQPLNRDSMSETRGSALSLTSEASSIYSSAEERQAAEIEKLRKELEFAKEQVFTLTSQLTTNAQVVQAFEQSLGNMTMRLHQLQSKSEQKDGELGDMKTTLENLRRMTGLAHTEILQSNAHAGSVNMVPQINGLERQLSADSINSLNSMGSACSAASSSADAKKKAKKNWIRNSFSKAFSRKKSIGGGSSSDVEGDAVSHHSEASTSSTPSTPTHAPMRGLTAAAAYMYLDNMEDMTPEAIAEMKRMLREKEMKLTDIRLDALTSAHQLEQLREAMNKMKTEMSYLKADNDRLHRIVGEKSVSVPSGSTPSGSLSSGGISLLSTSFSMAGSPTTALSSPVHRSFGADKLDFLSHGADGESDSGKRVTVSVASEENTDSVGCYIGSISVTGKTKWDVLDSLVKRIFKQYLSRIDQSTNLGLTSESIHAFAVGEVLRTKDGELPELLPYGYLVGDMTNIKIILKGAQHNSVDSLAFETGIPKSIIQRYASLLSEHRRIILSGPSGTGKSHLARHLAGYLIARSGKTSKESNIATFNGEGKSATELRNYLKSIQEQCESADASKLPSVVILDNLHHVSSLSDGFSGFLSPKSSQCPFIIGTMSQTTNATTNLQLQHNFRWILCANHMEPVKGFLGRFLRRKLVENETMDNAINNDMCKIVEWIPKVWQHVNKFIETHNCTEATIGPQHFLSCPMDVTASQHWFGDLWNYSLIPYLREAIREGLQKYGQKSSWEDPTDWLIQTYPWPLDTGDLLHLRTDDVGYDKTITVSKQPSSKEKESNGSSGQRDVDPSDPLYNMILRLREASYSQSDNDSLETHGSAILENSA